MSIKQSVAKYLNNHAETSDDHLNPTFQTHYYKTTKEKALKTIEDLLTNMQGYSIHSISKEHGEISLHYKKTFIIITIISTRPYLTAIDFSVTTESVLPFDFGVSTKIIENLYEKFDESLPYIKS